MSKGTGSIEVITGSMFSGKTQELIRRMERARIARQGVKVFKPAVDYRYGLDKVKSHAGAAFDAIPVQSCEDIADRLEADTTVVAIDEAQFFGTEIVQVCSKLAENGFRVLVAGLDQDFRGEPFGALPVLLALAEKVHKLHAICMVCGAEASRTQRLIDGVPAKYKEPIVMVGGKESYEARCRRHHVVPKKPEEENDCTE